MLVTVTPWNYKEDTTLQSFDLVLFHALDESQLFELCDNMMIHRGYDSYTVANHVYSYKVC